MASGKKFLDPKQAEANRAAALRGEIELDSLGRKKAGQNVNSGIEEEQVWSDPEDRSITKLVWRRVGPDDKRCTTIIKSKTSPWLGNRCCANAIHGSTVCYYHGGRLPSVKKAAQRRLAMAALPAADRLIYMALKQKKMSDSDRLKAILAILDRAGVEGKATVEIEVKPWQDALQSLMAKAEGRTEDATSALSDGEEIEGEYDGPSWNPEDDDE
jgi:hypothetical protein